MKIMKMKVPQGATLANMTDFGINIHIQLQYFESHMRSSLRQGVPG